MPQNSLNGSSSKPLAVITGAAGIIGPGIIKELRRSGWRTIATDRSQGCFDMHERAFGVPVEADAIIPADLGRQVTCQQLIEKIKSAHGEISAIIHGAALNPALEFTQFTEADVQESFAVNFAAPLYLIQAALPSLIRNRGVVINLSSVVVAEARKGDLLYACSKVALEKATEIMALELLQKGVRANTIRVGRVPGYAYLRETLRTLPDDLARKMVEDLLPQRIEEMRRSLGEQAIGTPEDIGQTVAFLLSSSARFINGQTLVLDGGYRPITGTAGKVTNSQIEDWLQENTSSGNLVPCES